MPKINELRARVGDWVRCTRPSTQFKVGEVYQVTAVTGAGQIVINKISKTKAEFDLVPEAEAPNDLFANFKRENPNWAAQPRMTFFAGFHAGVEYGLAKKNN